MKEEGNIKMEGIGDRIRLLQFFSPPHPFGMHPVFAMLLYSAPHWRDQSIFPHPLMLDLASDLFWPMECISGHGMSRDFKRVPVVWLGLVSCPPP